MPCIGVIPAFWAVLGLGLGGSTLGVIGRLWETRARRPCRSLLPAALGVTFLALAVIAWLTNKPGGVAITGAALAAVCLLGWGSRLSGPRRDMLRRLALAAVWGLLLIASPASSLYLARGLGENAPGVEDLVTPNDDVSPVRNDWLRAETDRGREIPLYNFKAPETAKAEESILARDYLKYQVIRIAGPDPTSNCHGWVFTGGECVIPNEVVDQILADNRYDCVSNPKPGDLIIYRNELGQVEHTGIVEAVGEDGMILVKSKWGGFGLYLHQPEAQPWSNRYAYYRSPRRGHKLKTLPTRAKKAQIAISVPVGGVLGPANC